MRKPLSLAISMALLPLTALPAFAQPSDSGLEEVTVTAQRREQNLQEVPISITAFSGESLARSNIRSASEYLSLTPNVSYTEDGQTGARGIGIAVRGVGTMVSGENAFINTVGVYIDEFSVISVPNQVANPELPDMERVEVLRGPQGTYFGRNAVGGALNLVSRRPTDELEGRVSAGYENYSSSGNSGWNVGGMVNVPVSDTFRLRAVGRYEDTDGYVDNICASGKSQASCPGAAENNVQPNGAKNSGHETNFLRLSADWDASEATSVKTTLFYTDEQQGTDENVPSGVLDLDSTDTFGVGVAQDPGTGFWDDNQDKLSHDIDEQTNNESLVGILNVSHELSDTMTVKWISGFIDASVERVFDNDLVGGLDALKRTNDYDGNSWSTELRLEIRESAYDLVVGALYAKDHQEQDNNVAVSVNPTGTINGVGILPPFPTGLGLARNSKEFEVESQALFADVTWHASDQLDVSVGARYTQDTVENKLQAIGAYPPANCWPPGTVPNCSPWVWSNAARPVANGDEDFDDITPRLVVRYELSDEMSVYGTVSKGYKAGGSSLGNNTNAPGQPAFAVKFDEETLWNYEIGFKSELMDNRLRLNGSVFYLEWQDLQMEAFRFLTPGDLSSNFEQTINIEDAEAKGVELELLAAVTDRLTLSGGLGWLDTEITSDSQAQITGGFVVDLKGLELPKSPEFSANAAAEYRFPFMMGGCECEGWVRLEFIHRDGQYSDIEGLTNKQTRGPSPNQGLVRAMPNGEFPYLSPDFDVWNLRAGVEVDKWAVSLFAQNLGEEDYYTGTQENFGLSGIRLRPHPRILGGSISYSF